MSIIAEWERQQAGLERRRWTQSSLAIVLATSALLAAWHWWPGARPSPAPAAMPLVLELAAMPQASSPPSSSPAEATPRAATPPPEATPALKTEPVVPQLPPSDIALPDEPVRASSSPESAPAAAAQAASESAPAAASNAAPLQGAQSLASHVAQISFRERLLGHLQRHKRYPQISQMRRQQGTPYVRFIMNRQGQVLSAQLERSSGHAALDTEAVALPKRAQPLPLLPADIPEPLEIVVPIEFFLPR